MKLFVQTFQGQVRTWFRGLHADSIATYDDLEATFLREWGEKKKSSILSDIIWCLKE
jgi:hypothetical protein